MTLVTFRTSAVRPVSEDEGGEVNTVHGGAAPGGQPGRAAPQDLGTEKKTTSLCSNLVSFALVTVNCSLLL